MKRSLARLTAEGTIAFIWRSACRKHWSPKRVRREFLKARNDFVERLVAQEDDPDFYSSAQARGRACWYRAARDLLPGRLRALPDVRQLQLFGKVGS